MMKVPELRSSIKNISSSDSMGHGLKVANASTIDRQKSSDPGFPSSMIRAQTDDQTSNWRNFSMEPRVLVESKIQ